MSCDTCYLEVQTCIECNLRMLTFAANDGSRVRSLAPLVHGWMCRRGALLQVGSSPMGRLEPDC